jgi:hypothetical protein
MSCARWRLERFGGSATGHLEHWFSNLLSDIPAQRRTMFHKASSKAMRMRPRLDCHT